MFKSDDVLRNLVTTQDLYCVWIRADETPGAPLIAVWMDTKMRGFDTVECGSASVATDCGAAEEAKPLTAKGVNHSI